MIFVHVQMIEESENLRRIINKNNIATIKNRVEGRFYEAQNK